MTATRKAHTRKAPGGGTVHVRTHTVHTRPGAGAHRTPSYSSKLQQAKELSVTSLAGVLVWSLARMFLATGLAVVVAVTVAALGFVAWSLTEKKRRSRRRGFHPIKRSKRKMKLRWIHFRQSVFRRKPRWARRTRRSRHTFAGPVNQHQPKDPSDLDQVTGEFADSAKRVAARIRTANAKPSADYVSRRRGE